MSDEVASSPALDLLLRLVGQQLASRRCPDCSRPLATSRMRIREQDAQQVVVELKCGQCGKPVLVTVSPDLTSR